MIAQAQSGTGKTATFSIAILQQIDMSINECQALILAPTRELAQQVRLSPMWKPCVLPRQSQIVTHRPRQSLDPEGRPGVR